jgi:hypothetical protein
MLKPKRKLIGTSEKVLKGEILLSILSHSSGIKGVLTNRRSGDHVTLLGIVGRSATEGAEMFTPATGALIASCEAVPRVTKAFPGFVNPGTS